MREVLNGLLYLLWTGCQWQALPKDLPPKSTVHHYFKLWDWDGTLERNHRQSKRQDGAKRGASMDPQGYDAGKKVTGRKRHILVDTLGLLLSVAVHPADIQDRDGVAYVLNASTRALFPFLERIFADGGYQGPRAAEAAAATGKWIIEIVKRNELHKFVVLPKRWIVERTFAWISRNRRLARDFERYATTVAAFIRLAMIRIMLRRLTRPTLCP